ncbi:MAG: hypothetical protein NTZ95_04200, partial [Candidatus Omnitrophica bacterium]|nr:hypothetical protein [Candidatus Omnitrophota bacterium]
MFATYIGDAEFDRIVAIFDSDIKPILVDGTTYPSIDIIDTFIKHVNEGLLDPKVDEVVKIMEGMRAPSARASPAVALDSVEQKVGELEGEKAEALAGPSTGKKKGAFEPIKHATALKQLQDELLALSAREDTDKNQKEKIEKLQARVEALDSFWRKIIIGSVDWRKHSDKAKSGSAEEVIISVEVAISGKETATPVSIKVTKGYIYIMCSIPTREGHEAALMMDQTVRGLKAIRETLRDPGMLDDTLIQGMAEWLSLMRDSINRHIPAGEKRTDLLNKCDEIDRCLKQLDEVRKEITEYYKGKGVLARFWPAFLAKRARDKKLKERGILGRDLVNDLQNLAKGFVAEAAMSTTDSHEFAIGVCGVCQAMITTAKMFREYEKKGKVAYVSDEEAKKRFKEAYDVAKESFFSLGILDLNNEEDRNNFAALMKALENGDKRKSDEISDMIAKRAQRAAYGAAEDAVKSEVEKSGLDKADNSNVSDIVSRELAKFGITDKDEIDKCVRKVILVTKDRRIEELSHYIALRGLVDTGTDNGFKALGGTAYSDIENGRRLLKLMHERRDALKARLPKHGELDPRKATAEQLRAHYEVAALTQITTAIQFGHLAYPEQVLAGIYMDMGYFVDMATGSGKTHTFPFQNIFSVLRGNKVFHGVTADAFGERDLLDTQFTYRLLGIKPVMITSAETKNPQSAMKKLENEENQIVFISMYSIEALYIGALGDSTGLTKRLDKILGRYHLTLDECDLALRLPDMIISAGQKGVSLEEFMKLMIYAATTNHLKESGGIEDLVDMLQINTIELSRMNEKDVKKHFGVKSYSVSADGKTLTITTDKRTYTISAEEASLSEGMEIIIGNKRAKIRYIGGNFIIRRMELTKNIKMGGFNVYIDVDGQPRCDEDTEKALQLILNKRRIQIMKATGVQVDALSVDTLLAFIKGFYVDRPGRDYTIEFVEDEQEALHTLAPSTQTLDIEGGVGVRYDVGNRVFIISTKSGEVINIDSGLFTDKTAYGISINGIVYMVRKAEEDGSFTIRKCRREIVLLDELTGRAQEGQRKDTYHTIYEMKHRGDEVIEHHLQHITVRGDNDSIELTTLPIIRDKMLSVSGGSGSVRTVWNAMTKVLRVMGVIALNPHNATKRFEQPEIFTAKKSFNVKMAAAQAGEICVLHPGASLLVYVSGRNVTKECEEMVAAQLEDMAKMFGGWIRVKRFDNETVEIEMVREAGVIGTVTITTSMLGRATDVKLADLAAILEQFGRTLAAYGRTAGEIGDKNSGLKMQLSDMLIDLFFLTSESARAAQKEKIRNFLEGLGIGRGHDVYKMIEQKYFEGLFIINTTACNNDQVKVQLNGRAGRQGDPAAVRTLLDISVDGDAWDLIQRVFDPKSHEREWRGFKNRKKREEAANNLKAAAKAQETLTRLHDLIFEEDGRFKADISDEVLSEWSDAQYTLTVVLEAARTAFQEEQDKYVINKAEADKALDKAMDNVRTFSDRYLEKARWQKKFTEFVVDFMLNAFFGGFKKGEKVNVSTVIKAVQIAFGVEWISTEEDDFFTESLNSKAEWKKERSRLRGWLLSRIGNIGKFTVAEGMREVSVAGKRWAILVDNGRIAVMRGEDGKTLNASGTAKLEFDPGVVVEVRLNADGQTYSVEFPGAYAVAVKDAARFALNKVKMDLLKDARKESWLIRAYGKLAYSIQILLLRRQRMGTRGRAFDTFAKALASESQRLLREAIEESESPNSENGIEKRKKAAQELEREESRREVSDTITRLNKTAGRNTRSRLKDRNAWKEKERDEEVVRTGRDRPVEEPTKKAVDNMYALEAQESAYTVERETAGKRTANNSADSDAATELKDIGFRAEDGGAQRSKEREDKKKAEEAKAKKRLEADKAEDYPGKGIAKAGAVIVTRSGKKVQVMAVKGDVNLATSIQAFRIIKDGGTPPDDLPDMVLAIPVAMVPQNDDDRRKLTEMVESFLASSKIPEKKNNKPIVAFYSGFMPGERQKDGSYRYGFKDVVLIDADSADSLSRSLQSLLDRSKRLNTDLLQSELEADFRVDTGKEVEVLRDQDANYHLAQKISGATHITFAGKAVSGAERLVALEMSDHLSGVDEDDANRKIIKELYELKSDGLYFAGERVSSISEAPEEAVTPEMASPEAEPEKMPWYHYDRWNYAVEKRWMPWLQELYMYRGIALGSTISGLYSAMLRSSDGRWEKSWRYRWLQTLKIRMPETGYKIVKIFLDRPFYKLLCFTLSGRIVFDVAAFAVFFFIGIIPSLAVKLIKAFPEKIAPWTVRTWRKISGLEKKPTDEEMLETLPKAVRERDIDGIILLAESMMGKKLTDADKDSLKRDLEAMGPYDRTSQFIAWLSKFRKSKNDADVVRLAALGLIYISFDKGSVTLTFGGMYQALGAALMEMAEDELDKETAKGLYVNAYYLLNLAVHFSPKNFTALAQRGLCLEKIGGYEQRAREDLEKAVKKRLNTELGDIVRIKLADMYEGGEKPDLKKALGHFERVEKKDSKRLAELRRKVEEAKKMGKGEKKSKWAKTKESMTEKTKQAKGLTTSWKTYAISMVGAAIIIVAVILFPPAAAFFANLAVSVAGMPVLGLMAKGLAVLGAASTTGFSWALIMPAIMPGGILMSVLTLVYKLGKFLFYDLPVGSVRDELRTGNLLKGANAWARREPDNIEARLARLDVIFSLGLEKDAKRELNRIKKRFKYDAAALRELAIYLLEKRAMTEDAFLIYEDMQIRFSRSNRHLLLLKARLLLEKSDKELRRWGWQDDEDRPSVAMACAEGVIAMSGIPDRDKAEALIVWLKAARSKMSDEKTIETERAKLETGYISKLKELDGLLVTLKDKALDKERDGLERDDIGKALKERDEAKAARKGTEDAKEPKKTPLVKEAKPEEAKKYDGPEAYRYEVKCQEARLKWWRRYRMTASERQESYGKLADAYFEMGNYSLAYRYYMRSGTADPVILAFCLAKRIERSRWYHVTVWPARFLYQHAATVDPLTKDKTYKKDAKTRLERAMNGLIEIGLMNMARKRAPWYVRFMNLMRIPYRPSEDVGLATAAIKAAQSAGFDLPSSAQEKLARRLTTPMIRRNIRESDGIKEDIEKQSAKLRRNAEDQKKPGVSNDKLGRLQNEELDLKNAIDSTRKKLRERLIAAIRAYAKLLADAAGSPEATSDITAKLNGLVKELVSVSDSAPGNIDNAVVTLFGSVSMPTEENKFIALMLMSQFLDRDFAKTFSEQSPPPGQCTTFSALNTHFVTPLLNLYKTTASSTLKKTILGLIVFIAGLRLFMKETVEEDGVKKDVWRGKGHLIAGDLIKVLESETDLDGDIAFQNALNKIRIKQAEELNRIAIAFEREAKSIEEKAKTEWDIAAKQGEIDSKTREAADNRTRRLDLLRMVKISCEKILANPKITTEERDAALGDIKIVITATLGAKTADAILSMIRAALEAEKSDTTKVAEILRNVDLLKKETENLDALLRSAITVDDKIALITNSVLTGREKLLRLIAIEFTDDIKDNAKLLDAIDDTIKGLASDEAAAMTNEVLGKIKHKKLEGKEELLSRAWAVASQLRKKCETDTEKATIDSVISEIKSKLIDILKAKEKDAEKAVLQMTVDFANVRMARARELLAGGKKEEALRILMGDGKDDKGAVGKINAIIDAEADKAKKGEEAKPAGDDILRCATELAELVFEIQHALGKHFEAEMGLALGLMHLARVELKVAGSGGVAKALEYRKRALEHFEKAEILHSDDGAVKIAIASAYAVVDEVGREMSEAAKARSEERGKELERLRKEETDLIKAKTDKEAAIIDKVTQLNSDVAATATPVKAGEDAEAAKNKLLNELETLRRDVKRLEESITEKGKEIAKVDGEKAKADNAKLAADGLAGNVDTADLAKAAIYALWAIAMAGYDGSKAEVKNATTILAAMPTDIQNGVINPRIAELAAEAAGLKGADRRKREAFLNKLRLDVAHDKDTDGLIAALTVDSTELLDYAAKNVPDGKKKDLVVKLWQLYQTASGIGRILIAARLIAILFAITKVESEKELTEGKVYDEADTQNKITFRVKVILEAAGIPDSMQDAMAMFVSGRLMKARQAEIDAEKAKKEKPKKFGAMTDTERVESLIGEEDEAGRQALREEYYGKMANSYDDKVREEALTKLLEFEAAKPSPDYAKIEKMADEILEIDAASEAGNYYKAIVLVNGPADKRWTAEAIRLLDKALQKNKDSEKARELLITLREARYKEFYPDTTGYSADDAKFFGEQAEFYRSRYTKEKEDGNDAAAKTAIATALRMIDLAVRADPRNARLWLSKADILATGGLPEPTSGKTNIEMSAIICEDIARMSLLWRWPGRLNPIRARNRMFRVVADVADGQKAKMVLARLACLEGRFDEARKILITRSFRLPYKNLPMLKKTPAYYFWLGVAELNMGMVWRAKRHLAKASASFTNPQGLSAEKADIKGLFDALMAHKDDYRLLSLAIEAANGLPEKEKKNGAQAYLERATRSPPTGLWRWIGLKLTFWRSRERREADMKRRLEDIEKAKQADSAKIELANESAIAIYEVKAKELEDLLPGYAAYLSHGRFGKFLLRIVHPMTRFTLDPAPELMDLYLSEIALLNESIDALEKEKRTALAARKAEIDIKLGNLRGRIDGILQNIKNVASDGRLAEPEGYKKELAKNLVRAAELEGDAEIKGGLYKRAVEADGQNGKALLGYAKVLKKAGRMEDANRLIDDAVARDPSLDDFSNTMLADLYSWYISIGESKKFSEI